MFNPTQQEVRQFYCDVFRKSRTGEVQTPLEAIAAGWVAQHPEYAALLADAQQAQAADYSVERGDSSPFLHLSMHLSIAEQISIDQPPGVRAAFTTLAGKLGSEHEAHHVMMEALGEMLWTSQRSGLPPDGAAYVERLQKTATARK
ncbi:MAG: hypothetical protein H6R01_1361 [Burkholderiaceae bacterium]|nr:hypothetical protein [Burkholderiaceae bacterium]